MEKAAFLVDGEAYFRAFRDVALQAKHSLIIVGWDLDTKTDLVRGETKPSELPRKLGEFVAALLRHKRKLRVYVLNWDFAMIFAMEREWMPTAEPGWNRHRRLCYRVDGHHPMGASHHQKIVVIDDSVAFVGGLDLSRSRWDTRAHMPHDPRRVDADGSAYAPFHDVQMMVAGQAARALGELARLRWHRATERRLPPVTPRPAEELWPASLSPDAEGCSVGMLRTQPAYEDQLEIREIQRAYLDAIKRARRSIYIESQYFTAHAIGHALATRLSEPEGPDVVLVLRHNCDGWLERQTMDILRSRLLNDLELADHYGRLQIYAPTVSGTDGAAYIDVHSKVLIVDDDFVSLGSANLSNRSMGFDTECNLAMESQGQPHLQAVIAAFRNGLLGEHLGVDAKAVTEQMVVSGSLTAAINALRGGSRSLERGCFERTNPAIVIPDRLLVDPERPIMASDFFDTRVHQKERRYISRRLVIALSLLSLLGILAAAWRWTPLGEWLGVESLLDSLHAMGRSPEGFISLLGGYVVGGFLAVPITLLIVVTVIVFGPWIGAPFAVGGSLLSAAVLFAIGRLLGRYRVQQLAGRHVAYLSRRLAERGLWAVLVVRILPIAPFSMVNLVAGSTPLSLRNFILGTMLGMMPGILVTATLVDRLEEAVRKPSPMAWTVLGLLILGAWVAAWFLSRRLLAGKPQNKSTGK